MLETSNDTVWSFIEKTSVKQDLQCKVCSNFQISLLHLDRWTPIDKALGQVDIFVRSSDEADFWSDIPPSIRLWLWLTFSDLWARLTFGQTYTPGSGFGAG